MQARSPRLPPTDSAKAGRGEQNPTAKNQSRAFNLNRDIVRRTGAGRRPGAASHRKGCIRRVASVNRRKRHGKRTLNAALGTRTGHDAHKATYTSRNVPPWTYRSHSAPPRTHKSHSAPPRTYESHSTPPSTKHTLIGFAPAAARPAAPTGRGPHNLPPTLYFLLFFILILFYFYFVIV